MTVLAGRQIAVLVLVTEDTLQFGMLACPAGQRIGKIAVTGCAVDIGYILVVLNIQRLMHLVAADAVGKFLTFPVWFMTFHAVGNVAVFVMMADRTVEAAVSTGIVFYFVDLAGMTGVTDGDIVFAEDDMQRLMRILMTTEAWCFHFKVGLAFMAF